MRLLALCLAAVVAAIPAGCSKQAAPAGKTGQPIRVLCSTFPIYLFTRTVAAGSKNLQVDLMIPAGMGCPHDYALTPQDMQKISTADVFVANGLGLEEFLGTPFKSANPRVKLVDTSAGIGDLIQITDEAGPEADHFDRAAYSPVLAREGSHHHDSNPHLFASPRMAARIVGNISVTLVEVDPAEADLFRSNAGASAAALDKLADDLAAELKPAQSRKIVTEHAIFDYLARDCGLAVAAVIEETPGQEPSAHQMIELARRIHESGAAALFTEPQYPAKVGQTIALEVGIPVATLDPVATGPENPPVDYYEKTMRANLETLKKTLVAGTK